VLLVVGRIGKAQGIRGEVTVELRTDAPEERFAPGAQLITEPDRGLLVVETVRPRGSAGLVVGFEGVLDRNAAEELRGTLLSVDTTDDPVLDDPDEYYDHQIVGLVAVGVDGVELGPVTDVLHLPGQDVLVVVPEPRPAGGSPELLIPFVREIVPTVDLKRRVVVVDPPPGLLDLGAPKAAEDAADADAASADVTADAGSVSTDAAPTLEPGDRAADPDAEA
jgi:16S rRNA processing protein RimM